MNSLSAMVDFLRARLDEDKWVAEGAARDHGTTWKALVTFPPHGSDSTDDHIARHDPARVLREVEVKRQIVERAAASIEGEDPPRASALFASGILLLIARLYVDHPDFPDAWRP